MPPLDPRLLASLRADRPAPPEVRGRVRGRLAAVIPGMAPTVAPQGGVAPTNTWGRFGTWGPTGMAVAAFVAGGVTGAALLSAFSHPTASRVVFVDRPVASLAPAAIAPLGPPPLLIAAEPLPEDVTPVSTLPVAPMAVIPRAIASSPPSAPAAAHTSRLSDERKLLDDARSGLLQGDPEAAIERLESHRTRFADGLLAEEREAMEVEALVRAGRTEEAREKATAFRARSPQSLFLPTVESAIAPTP